MEDRKKLARIANRIREGLFQLKYSRYMELNRQLKTLTGQLQRLTTESRKMDYREGEIGYPSQDRPGYRGVRKRGVERQETETPFQAY